MEAWSTLFVHEADQSISGGLGRFGGRRSRVRPNLYASVRARIGSLSQAHRFQAGIVPLKIIYQVLADHEAAGVTQTRSLSESPFPPCANHHHGQPGLLTLQKQSRWVKIFLVFKLGGLALGKLRDFVSLDFRRVGVALVFEESAPREVVLKRV